jgi:hypothetical protein
MIVKILIGASLLFFSTSCIRVHSCECEITYDTGKTGYDYYPLEGTRSKADRKCRGGRVSEDVKVDRGNCTLLD